MGYTLVRPEDDSVEVIRGAFFKLRRALGTTAFGINEIRLPPGTSGLEHDERETGHEEVYVAIEGDGSVAIDGEHVPLKAGEYLRVDADATRKITAGAAGLRFLVVGGKPLPAYDGRETL